MRFMSTGLCLSVLRLQTKPRPAKRRKSAAEADDEDDQVSEQSGFQRYVPALYALPVHLRIKVF